MTEPLSEPRNLVQEAIEADPEPWTHRQCRPCWQARGESTPTQPASLGTCCYCGQDDVELVSTVREDPQSWPREGVPAGIHDRSH